MLKPLRRAARTLLRPDPSLAEAYPDLDADVLAHVAAVTPYTMTSVERMAALHAAVRHVSRRGLPGAVVECGVWRGGSAMLAARVLLEEGDERDLWLYDTFEGMDEPGDADVNFRGVAARDKWAPRQSETHNDWCYASLTEVSANLAETGYPEARLRFVRGRVEDTIPRELPDRIALLRLDTDFYASTRHELEHLYPRLVSGGVLILDDYGWWRGAREATDEYFATLDAPPLLTRLDNTGRLAVKP